MKRDRVVALALRRKRDTLSLLLRPYLGTPESRARFEPALLCTSGKTVEVADPVSWLMIRAGWKVVAADGSEVGEVDEVAGDDTEDIFDGLAIATSAFGKPRYVPAEQIAGISQGVARLSLTREQVIQLGEYLEPATSAEIEAKRLLRRLHRMTSDDARIIADSRDVERRGAADAPWHARYRKRNLERGRLPGQIRIRIRFPDLVGPWMDYPMVSPDQLREIVDGTGWYVAETIDSDDTYIAVIEKAG